MKLKSISWEQGKIVLIDQTKLPGKLVYISCRTEQDIWRAVKALKVRGAPAIGVAAAFGLVLGLKRKRVSNLKQFLQEAEKISAYLASCRPTAVNLVWALNRVNQRIAASADKPVSEIKKLIEKEAMLILSEDQASCEKMADFGQELIHKNDSILTYCNTGILATAGMGTALSLIYRAHQLKKKIKVYSCETRPLLQGARLTCWELKAHGVDATLICDNTAAYLMQQKKIDKIFVGADRIVRNGDAANKIGTYSLAVLARAHGVPFYIVAPRSTFDLNSASGEEIKIEERSGSEITSLWFKQPLAPENQKTYNPAFDVIPARLISAIITDHGVFRPPFQKKIISCFGK